MNNGMRARSPNWRSWAESLINPPLSVTRERRPPSAMPARPESPAAAPRSRAAIRQFHRWCGGNLRITPARPVDRCRYRAKPPRRRSCADPPPRAGGLPLRPLPYYLVDGVEPVGERRRTRLQNQRRFDLVQLAVAHRRHRVPSIPGRHLIRPEALAAPGTENDIRGAAYDLTGIAENAILGQSANRALGKHVIAAGDADQLADPSNAGDERLVPFFKVDAWTARQERSRLPHAFGVCFQLERIALRPLGGANQCAEPAHVTQDPVDRAMIADPHFDPALDQRLRYVGLDVGEADHQIRPKAENAVHLGAGERGDSRLFPTRACRTHREAGNAHDPVFQPKRIKYLGGLFRQADHSARVSGAHVTASEGAEYRSERPVVLAHASPDTAADQTADSRPLSG